MDDKPTAGHWRIVSEKFYFSACINYRLQDANSETVIYSWSLDNLKQVEREHNLMAEVRDWLKIKTESGRCRSGKMIENCQCIICEGKAMLARLEAGIEK